MPTVLGLELAYALHLLPPGRLPFRRWRWELWHGGSLVAAGWRLSQAEAARALRVQAGEFGHRMFGLRPPPRDPRAGRGDLVLGASERFAVGPVTCLLVPRALERPAALAGS